MPKISICIPTYNGQKFLKYALESVKNQTYKDFEVIISDDQSSDSTLEICNKFKEEVDFPVFIYSHLPAGIGANWNNCVEKANGEYIKFLFQDDTLQVNCLEVMMENAVEYSSKIVVCKRNLIIDNELLNDDKTKKWQSIFGDLQKKETLFRKKDKVLLIDKNLFKSKSFLSSPLNKIGEPIVGLIHRDVYKKVGLYNTDLKQVLDYEYWYRILISYNILLIEDKLVNFRVHKQQTTKINENNGINEYGVYLNFVKDNLKPFLHLEVRKKFFPTIIERIIKKIKT